MTQPSLDSIIERLQLSIVDAKPLQLKMLERILSIALLQALDDKYKSECKSCKILDFKLR